MVVLRSGVVVGSLGAMLAAEVWHWWIGVALTGVAVLAGIGLIGGYLKSVSSQRHPGGKQARDADL